MLSTNTNFDTKHALSYKTPAYKIEFDGETVYYCDYIWTGTSAGVALLEDTDVILLEDAGDMLLEGEAYKRYLDNISGLAQKIVPEEGKSSIGGLKFELVDTDDEITALLATDSYYFHRKKVTVKAGYQGMTESDMIQIMVGWVTGISMDGKLTKYIFDATDPQKWMQRKIFRGSEDSTVTISGNPINILLRCLTSTGDGTNGDYDTYDAVNGLALDDDYIDVTGIEAVRDNWFPGDSHYMRFSITERIKAKDFFEKEIFKVLNIYPVIDGQGRFTVKPFKPPIAALETVQSFTGDNIIGLPKFDFNLSSMVNEVELFYDHDGDDYLSEAFYVDSTSLNNRGPGKKPVTIKSKGLHTSHSPASIAGRATDVLVTRKNRIFGRFASPPIKLKFNAFFSRWLTEVGDIVPFTHSNIPDIVAGTRGLTADRMEVISKNVAWRKGRVSFELLDTGFSKGTYQVISPTMTIVSASDAENFVVSAADATKYSTLTSPEIQLCDSKMRQRVAAKTLLTVNTTTGACTCDDMGLTPTAGDIVLFADYGYATSEQQLWGYIGNASDDLGLGWLKFDNQTGTFTVGNTITGGTSGATGTIDNVWRNGTSGALALSSVSGTFQDDEVIYESALGVELVTNGNFASWTGDDPDDWTVLNEDVNNYVTENPAGQANLVSDVTAALTLQQSVTTVINNFYIITFDLSVSSGQGRGGLHPDVATVNYTSAPTWCIKASATTTTPRFYRYNLGSSDVSYDNVSMKQITNAALANGTLLTATNDDAHLIIP